MKKYRVTDISTLGLQAMFVDEEYEAEDEIDAKEEIMNEIMDNIGNFIYIEVEEIEDEEESDYER